MAFKYSDYIITPADLYRWVSRMKKGMRRRDVLGALVLLTIYACGRSGLGWQADSAFFFIFFLAVFYWNMDARIAIGLVFVSLLSCPFLLILYNDFEFAAGINGAGRMAQWAYYLFFTGITKLVWDFRAESETAKEGSAGEIFPKAAEEQRDAAPEKGPSNAPRGAGALSILSAKIGRLFAAAAGYARKKEAKRFLPQAIFFSIAGVIMLPFFLQRGFLFLLDMVWGPDFLFSGYLYGGVAAPYPVKLALDFLNIFLPADLLQKMFLCLILYLCGRWMFALSRHLMPRSWAVLAAVFYMLNPYVFERLLSGQWMVLLGYAFLPLMIWHYLVFLGSDKRRDFWIFALLFSLYPILSLHWAYIAYFLLLLILIIHPVRTIIRSGLNRKEAARKIKESAGLAIRLGSLWLIVNFFYLGSLWNAENTAGKITQNDFRAFATAADPDWGTLFNVLSLYGFWQDAYFLPKDVFSYWWVLTFLVVASSLFGLYHAVKRKDLLATALAIAFVPALLISAGYGDGACRPLTDLLLRYLPGFAGLRETAKVAGLLAFTYALFFPPGVKLALDRLCRSAGAKAQRQAYAAAIVLSGALCLLSVNNIFLGFDGQVRATPYPESWHEARTMLEADAQIAEILALPWRGYMEVSFANNVNAANVQRAFFGESVISGRNQDGIYLTDRSQEEWDNRIADMLSGSQSPDDNIDFFKAQNVTHIILAKTADWRKYSFLDGASKLRKIFEAQDIALYKIQN